MKDYREYIMRMLKRALAVALICLLSGCSHSSPQRGPVALAKVYDNRLEAPCPPEVIATLLDKVIEKHSRNVKLTLVPHPEPSRQPSGNRTAWVCTVDGKLLWAVSKAPDLAPPEDPGITARAIARARNFVANSKEANLEFGNAAIPNNWHPKKEALLPAYQSRVYGMQITGLELRDQESQSWKITVEPISDNTAGGEIWMWFDSLNSGVSAEYGK